MPSLHFFPSPFHFFSFFVDLIAFSTPGFLQLRLHYGNESAPVCFVEYQDVKYSSAALQILQGKDRRLRIEEELTLRDSEFFLSLLFLFFLPLSLIVFLFDSFSLLSSSFLYSRSFLTGLTFGPMRLRIEYAKSKMGVPRQRYSYTEDSEDISIGVEASLEDSSESALLLSAPF